MSRIPERNAIPHSLDPEYICGIDPVAIVTVEDPAAECLTELFSVTLEDNLHRIDIVCIVVAELL
jgi:hypothetical protein